MKPSKATIVYIVLFAVLGSACTRAWPGTPTPQPSLGVDPVFWEFYQKLGGEGVFGPPISPSVEQDGLKLQYTEAALLVYHPEAPPDQAVFLAPLGLEMGVSEPPREPPPAEQSELFLNGHIVYKEFVPLFQQLGGVSVVGPPLNEASYNIEKDRIEQFFGNLGFYAATQGDEIRVDLLAYGAWKCDFVCRYAPPASAAIELPGMRAPGEIVEQPPIEEQLPVEELPTGMEIRLPLIVQTYPARAILEEALTRLATSFSGFALTDVYMADDGMMEQVYENVVIYADPNQPDHFALRPVPELVGISPGVPKEASEDESMTFIEVGDGLGFNVASYFMQYLRLHGGLELSGPPVTAFAPLDENVNMQCFRYYCLEEHKNTPDGMVVRPASLGYRYLEKFYADRDLAPFESTEEVREVTLQYWKRYPVVATNQPQEIDVVVMENRSPLAGIQPAIIITQPDGTSLEYKFPLTGQDGRASIILPPVDAPNSTVITYQICIPSQSNETFCVLDNYLIWNVP